MSLVSDMTQNRRSAGEGDAQAFGYRVLKCLSDDVEQDLMRCLLLRQTTAQSGARFQTIIEVLESVDKTSRARFFREQEGSVERPKCGASLAKKRLRVPGRKASQC